MRYKTSSTTSTIIKISYRCSPRASPLIAESRMAGKRPTKLMIIHLEREILERPTT